MSVGFHLNLTFPLKPEVGGIKIVSQCLQTTHFPSWVAHSHFDLVLDPLTTIYRIKSALGLRSHERNNAPRSTKKKKVP